MKNNLSRLITVAIFIVLSAIGSQAQYWSLNGNTGISAKNNFLGTTDTKALVFRTYNKERMRITNSGNVLIDSSGNYVSLSTPGLLTLGSKNLYNITMDVDDIQARFNGDAASLYINYYGGTTFVGSSAYSLTGLVSNGSQYGMSGYSSGSGSTGVNGGGPSDGFGVAGSAYYGVHGYSSSGGYGVYGQGADFAYGVEGYSVKSIGVYGATGSSSSYAGFFVGSVYTTGIYAGSDENLKQHIRDFLGALDIINQLHPKVYEYRQDGNYKQMDLPLGEHYGLIAQDVEKVLPNLVKASKFDLMKPVQHTIATNAKNADAQTAASIMTKTGETIDFKALNYIELIPVIIKGMQEQEAVIQQQQQQIDELKQLVLTLASNASDAKAANTGNAWLLQNSPNPFNQNTIIRCYVPSSVKKAQLIIYNTDGQLIKSYSLTNGMNNVTVTGGTLSSGQYLYSLLADGKKFDTKSMTITQ